MTIFLRIARRPAGRGISTAERVGSDDEEEDQRSGERRIDPWGARTHVGPPASRRAISTCNACIFLRASAIAASRG